MIDSLQGWNDHSSIILARGKLLNDYVFKYWKKLKMHLDTLSEASAYNETFESFMIITSPARHKTYYRSMGFRCNSKFPERLAKRAKHTFIDLFNFFTIHEKQLLCYCNTTDQLRDFICKYIAPPENSIRTDY